MDVRSDLSRIETAIGDPRAGLPQDVFLFVSRLTPLVNVDLLIQDGAGRTLLTWRDDQFFGPGWHVPGGIIRFKEPMTERLHACAREELRADVEFDLVPILVAESIDDRRSRGHFISLLFRCRLVGEPDPALRAGTDPPAPGHWRWHDRCPPNLLEEQRHYSRFF